MKTSSIINRLCSLLSEEELIKKVLKIYIGQKKCNRVDLRNHENSHSYFEFGDLRLEFESSRIIVEVDTAGGVTNLAKYYYMLNEPDQFNFNGIKSDKMTYMLHIFVCKGENDYNAHRRLWGYLSRKLEAKNFKAEMEIWNTNEYENQRVKSKLKNILEEAVGMRS